METRWLALDDRRFVNDVDHAALIHPCLPSLNHLGEDLGSGLVALAFLCHLLYLPLQLHDLFGLEVVILFPVLLLFSLSRDLCL